MTVLPGSTGAVTLRDDRVLDYWEGGDPGGVPVVLHPGTPCSRLMGTHFDADARAVGVRLVSVSRPGYGASTPTPPGLRSVAEDTLELADLLGLGAFSVCGLSGGGPYAVALGVVAPTGRVRAVGVAAGVGEWPVVDPPSPDADTDRRLLATARDGDLAAAFAGFVRDAERQLRPLLALDDAAMVAAFLASVAGNESRQDDDPDFRARWAADLREAGRSFDGYARDNLSWGLPWDVDPGASPVPNLLWYGDRDTMASAANGRWLAAQLPDVELTVFEGEGHGAVIFDHGRELLGRLTD